MSTKCEEDVVSETVNCVASDMHVDDSTQQLAFVLLVQHIISKTRDIEYHKVVRDTIIRLFTSFVTHHAVSFVIVEAHRLQEHMIALRQMLSDG